MKEAFDWIFHPGDHKWRLQGKLQAFTSLQWAAGLF
jgi:hypothetical protein